MKIVIELEKSISIFEAEDIITWLESYPAIHKATILNECGDCHNDCRKVKENERK